MLVIGTKADVAERRRRGGPAAWLAAAAAAAAAPALRCAAGLRAALARRGFARARLSRAPGLLPEYASREERDAHLFSSAGLRAAATLGCELRCALRPSLFAARITLTGGPSRALPTQEGGRGGGGLLFPSAARGAPSGERNSEANSHLVCCPTLTRIASHCSAPQAGGGHMRSASASSAGGTSPRGRWSALLAADVAMHTPRFDDDVAADCYADQGADSGRLAWADESPRPGGGGGSERALWEP